VTRMRPNLLAGLVAWLPLSPATRTPEIRRVPVAHQDTGVAQAPRTIPEASVRLEGTFTGQADTPYDFRAVRTSQACQPRARLVDPAKARPTVEGGWVLNDVIRVPHAACPSQEAVVTVWRKPADAAPPELDGQGRSRIYLDESMEKIASGDLAPVPLYAAALSMQGNCTR